MDHTHSPPEWTHPDGGALPIEYGDILRAGHKTEAEISATEEELESLTLVEGILA